MPNPAPSSRFIVLLSVIAVATIVVTTAVLLFQLRVRELRDAEGETVALSGIISEQTTRTLQSVDLAMSVALDRIADAERRGTSLWDTTIHAMLQSSVAGMPYVRSMAVVGADGTVYSSARSDPALHLQVADREYFKGARDSPNGALFIGAPIYSRTDGTRTLPCSRAIRKRNGDFGGVIVVALDLHYFESLYGSIKLGTVGMIALSTLDGALIVRQPYDDAAFARKIALPSIPVNEGRPASLVTVRTGGEDSGVVTYGRIGRFPLILSVGNRDHDALGDWREFARIITADASLWTCLLLVVTLLLWLEQKREAKAVRAAQESGERLRAVVDAGMDAIITADEAQRIVLFNPAAESMFGYSADKAVGTPLGFLLPELHPVVGMPGAQVLPDGELQPPTENTVSETSGCRADGRTFPVEMTMTRVSVGGQTLFTAILRDISLRRRSEDQLRQSHQQLRDLATSLQTVREEERTSIARELHDELGQQLMRLNMDLSWLGTKLKSLSPPLHDKVRDMKHLAESTVDTVRRVTTQLRPLLLDDLGLVDAIRWQLDDFAQRSGIVIKSDLAVDDLVLDAHVATNVFRILQESLTNVARHAGASEVMVSLTRTEQGLVLDVRDDGYGADLNHVPPGSGYGLVGIRERVLALGGRTEISSAPGHGFTIHVEIPLDAAKPQGDGK
ncbi:MAG: PAS domain S-box protein [Rhodocyclaceae bacterium]|nr:PAS domain S-box protein [Rhodocyclaceae bacterium]